VYSGTSSGGGGVWGTITGTLSAQTDLQSALDLKVPTSRTLTINGVSQDLSANRTYTIDALPSQTGNSGKYLTTNGTIASWGVIDLSGYVPYTGANANLDLGTFDLTTDIINLNQLKAIGSGGLNIYSNSGTHIVLMGGGGGAGTTFYGGLIGTTASFASSGGSDTFAINHSSGSGIGLNITKGGNGEGLYINKTSGSGNAATIIGTLNATTLVKSGGTSSQFLKADGSVDSSTYVAGTGVANQLTYWNGTGSVTGSAGLTYNDTTGAITLSKNQNADTLISISNTTNGAASRAYFQAISNLTGQFVFGKTSQSYTPYKIFGNGDAFIFNDQFGDIAILNDFGSGKIKFAAGASSTAQLTLTAAGRLLLGTTSEGTEMLKVSGSMLIGTSGNAIPLATNVARFVSNTTGSDVEINGNGYARLYFNDYSRGTDLKYYEMLNFNGDWKISRLNDANTLRTERLTIFGATGNVFVGSTPSDAGYKLDVNGTARVSGDLRISAGSTLNWNNVLTAQNRLLFYDDGNSAARTGIGQNAAADLVNFCYNGKNIIFAMGNDATNVTTANASAYFDSTRRLNLNYNLLIPTGTKILMNAGQYGAIYSAANIGMVIEPFDLAAVRPFIVYQNTGGSVGIGDNSGGAINSAQLFLNSTTKGFLPPRMTTTQKNAIVTPAQGLMLFDTTLNKLCVYTGTSWETITSL
jgi:hypothetical protein